MRARARARASVGEYVYVCVTVHQSVRVRGKRGWGVVKEDGVEVSRGKGGGSMGGLGGYNPVSHDEREIDIFPLGI